ncbi:MAG: hypothetical protein IPN02_05950 [Candidatus Microthrix sp.]|uniref:Transposase DDE domain-containing protein n=1 Tax=Candidatus Neomicrothrix subdominans TaxID=2954438 RepID=A0A936TDU7_9ACTN|nr:hypothetical protein [Candidatus Microthrix subdominans]
MPAWQRSRSGTDVHDFPDPVLGKGILYGLGDVANNEGRVPVGDTADTSEFAVAAIVKWWDALANTGSSLTAKRLLITADCGGSNGYRVRAWKWHLARPKGRRDSASRSPRRTTRPAC